MRPLRVLAIETSCDDTAVAVVSSCRRVLASVILTQHQQHEPYGGIVPRLAAQMHRDRLAGAIAQCVTAAGPFDAVAATRGPGLGPCLAAGFEAGRCIAAATGRPFHGIHHMEAHALTARLADAALAFPFLGFLISGGHTLLVAVRGVGDYSVLGSTLDDSVGEALDKATRMLRIPQLPDQSPAAALEAIAAPMALGFQLPQPLERAPGLDFSFSGLKSSLRHRLETETPVTDANRAGLAHEFQRVATAHLCDRLSRALRLFPELQRVVVSGGVARNRHIRAAIAQTAGQRGAEAVFAPMEYCSDNAVMVAWAAIENIRAGMPALDPSAPAAVLPDWPLDRLKL